MTTVANPSINTDPELAGFTRSLLVSNKQGGSSLHFCLDIIGDNGSGIIITMGSNMARDQYS